MEKIQVEVTKLFKIMQARSIGETELQKLIKSTNNGKCVTKYILNGIINGKRKNYNLKTLKMIKVALDVPYEDLIDE